MQLGQGGGDWASKWAGLAGLGRLAWAHFGPVHVLLRLVLLPESSKSSPLLHVGPCRRFLSELDELLVLQDSALFWLGPRSFPSSRAWSLGSWSHVHFIA
jgi:hypothetical protein